MSCSECASGSFGVAAAGAGVTSGMGAPAVRMLVGDSVGLRPSAVSVTVVAAVVSNVVLIV